ncbi:hypothetical protein ACQY0O_002527 [Thecaphora frezii]
MAVIDMISARDSLPAAQRDPDVFGESSKSGAHFEKRATDDSEAIPLQRREPSRGHAAHRLEARSPNPAPIPVPLPMPTPPPNKRSVNEPDRLRLGPRDFVELLDRDDAAGGHLVGPFYPRDADEIELIKRQVSEKRRRGQFRTGQANDVLDLVARRSPQDANTDLLAARSLEERIRSWELGRRDSYQGMDESRRVDLERRQTTAQEQCFVGNEDLSCYPTAGTQIVQNHWARFIWNANYPSFTQAGFVDVYLFHQDTDDVVTSWTSQDNGAGRLSFRPNDAWWQDRTAAANIQPNQNITWPFYFVVLPSGQSLTGTTSRLATWSAVQTALPVAIARSRSAASASAASLASLSRTASATATPTATSTNIRSIQSAIESSLSEALESSLHASGFTGTETLVGTTTATLPNGLLFTATATAQANGAALGGDDNGNGLALPTYAIVLIAVLGFLALVAAIAGAYFIMAALRKRRQAQNQRGSFGSGSPMMAAAAGSLAGASTDAGHTTEASHMLHDDHGSNIGAGCSAGAGAGYAAGGAARTRSLQSEDSHLFTSDEATRMADAFRNALRRPDFAPSGFGESSGGEASGESPMEDTLEGGQSSRVSALLREELAAEGKDLQSVGDRRKATWHEEE